MNDSRTIGHKVSEDAKTKLLDDIMKLWKFAYRHNIGSEPNKADVDLVRSEFRIDIQRIICAEVNPVIDRNNHLEAYLMNELGLDIEKAFKDGRL